MAANGWNAAGEPIDAGGRPGGSIAMTTTTTIAITIAIAITITITIAITIAIAIARRTRNPGNSGALWMPPTQRRSMALCASNRGNRRPPDDR
jgi:hypothetical protein